MTAYVVAQITIDDRDEYARYEAGFAAAFAPYGGRMLSVSEEPHILEGEWSCTRTVLIEFDDHNAALAWYHSPEYQSIIGHRQAAATGNAVIVDGFVPR